MFAKNERVAFNETFCRRVKEMREARARLDKSWTAEKMAGVLGVPTANYRKYETRTPLPHYLVPRFAAIMGVTISYVLTGKNEPSPVAIKLAIPE